MRAAILIAAFILALSPAHAAQGEYNSPFSILDAVMKNADFSIFDEMLGMANASNMTGIMGNGSGNASGGNVPAGPAAADSGVAPALQLPYQPPVVKIPLSQLRIVAALIIILFYVFAAGKIADFLQSTGRRITKREALLSPFAMMAVSGAAIAFYFISGIVRPPQDTLITNAVYLVLIPAGITVGAGAVVLYGFFRDRLNAVQSLDLSLRIVFAPIFDGLRGYWVALGAAAVLGLISTMVFYSSGGRFSLATYDFFLASAVISLYFLYRAVSSRGTEERASNVVTVLCIMAPSMLQQFLKDTVCSLLSMVPFGIFRACPLDAAGSEASLALSVGATMLLLVPLVPIIYAFTVNLLRAWTLAALLLSGEKGRRVPEDLEEEPESGYAEEEADEKPKGGPRPRIEYYEPPKKRHGGKRA